MIVGASMFLLFGIASLGRPIGRFEHPNMNIDSTPVGGEFVITLRLASARPVPVGAQHGAASAGLPRPIRGGLGLLVWSR